MSVRLSRAATPANPDLVALEQQLVGLLLEYEILRAAWPKAEHVLDRAKIGRQVNDILDRIHGLEKEIASAQAHDLAGAAVQLRRTLAALESHDCMVPGPERERIELRLLVSALAAIDESTRGRHRRPRCNPKTRAL